MAELPGADGRALRLTPYHPVLIDGAWRFPAELGPVAARECEAVFSFAIAGGAVGILVEGVACATWGHGLAGGAVAHPYFGSRAAVDDLARMPGYAAGHVDLNPGQVVRDPSSGLVCGLRPPPLA